MIYTLTFNPALDYILKFSDFCEGLVNRPAAESYLPGGKGINVSVVLSNLNIKNIALGFVAGFTGKEIEQVLISQGVDTDFITLSDGLSRINVKLKSKKETEINANGPTIADSDIRLLFDKLGTLKDGDFLVLAGSIPKSVSNTIYSDIMKMLSHKKINIVVDAEKGLLENALPFKPFLIKPNHHELGDIFGKNLESIEEIAKCAKILRDRGARNVMVSMAGDGGVLASEDGKVMFCPAPEGKVVNSTGAGDSAVAGFLAGYISSQNYKDAFKTALCAGSASTFSEFLATEDEINALYKSMDDSKIKYL